MKKSGSDGMDGSGGEECSTGAQTVVSAYWPRRTLRPLAASRLFFGFQLLYSNNSGSGWDGDGPLFQFIKCFEQTAWNLDVFHVGPRLHLVTQSCLRAASFFLVKTLQPFTSLSRLREVDLQSATPHVYTGIASEVYLVTPATSHGTAGNFVVVQLGEVGFGQNR